MTKYTDFKQVKVRYTDVGKGRTIVLLHGFMESLDIWNKFSKQLSKSFRVICIDLPGFGETPGIGYVHTMELMAKCVKAVLDKERLRHYVLIGHSMGGYVSLAFADLFNDNLKGMSLFNSTALADTQEKKENRDKAIIAIKKNHKQFVKLFFETLLAPQNRKRFKDELKRLVVIANTISKQALVNSLEGMKDRPKRDWILEMAKYPVLFIVGKHDAVIPYESVLKQAELVKNATVVLLENAGHLAFLEEEEATIKAVKKFARYCFRS